MDGFYHHGLPGLHKHIEGKTISTSPFLQNIRPAQPVWGVRVQLHVPPQPALAHHSDQHQEATVQSHPWGLLTHPQLLLSPRLHRYICIQRDQRSIYSQFPGMLLHFVFFFIMLIVG